MAPRARATLIISDTNILSSFAAGDSVQVLLGLFEHAKIYIPPAVLDEVLVAIAHGKIHLQSLLQSISDQQIVVLTLTADESHLLDALPRRLNIGERQAIILAQQRKGILLSNDRRAVRYCEQQGIRSLELVDVLRLLWTRQILSRSKVRQLIERMQRVEDLTLTEEQRSIIFGSHRSNQ